MSLKVIPLLQVFPSVIFRVYDPGASRGPSASAELPVKTLSPSDSKRKSVCTDDREFHLNIITLLHYLVKVETFYNLIPSSVMAYVSITCLYDGI